MLYCCLSVAGNDAAKSTGINGNIQNHQSEMPPAEVVENDKSSPGIVADYRSDKLLCQHTTAAATPDNRDMSAVLTSGHTRTNSRQNNATPVVNGALEININSTPATGDLNKPNIPSEPSSDMGDHYKQSNNYHPEPASDAEFIAVVRRKRKDAGAKQKAHQSENLSSYWHRKPAGRGWAHGSSKSTVHRSTGRHSPSQIQPVSQKPSNPPGVGFWDSTPSAFPALPSPRARRNSTGDVPATESNDDGSDLESVKSLQTSSSRQTNCSHGTSSYASVVVGNVNNKELVTVSVSQLSTSIPPKSPLSDSGVDTGSCPLDSYQSTLTDSSHMEGTDVAGLVTGNLYFMMDSSIVCEDKPCTDQTISNSDQHMQSRSCPHTNRCSHTVLFFDTRSKTSNTPVPSLDISFGFDDTLVSEAISSCNIPVAGELQSISRTPPVSQVELSTSVEFLQRSSVSYPSNSCHSSATASPRSSFDLRSAQKYLLSGEC